MGRVITAHLTCDRCNAKMGEVEVNSNGADVVGGPSKAPDFQFKLCFNPKDLDDDHPAPAEASYEELCEKCKRRVADLMAQALMQKPPTRRKNDESETAAK